MRLASFACLVVVCTALSASGLESDQFPLRVAAGHRYFEDQQGRPVFLQGDAPWSLIVGLSKADARRYLEARQRQGFNALIVNLIEHEFNGPLNRDGQRPFTTPGDFSTPNEAYFAHADWVLREASARGMTVLLFPMYLGYADTDEGWYEEAQRNGTWKTRLFGRWVGARYQDFANLVWMLGGDRAAGNAREEVRALAQGLREGGATQLFGAHPQPEGITLDEYGFAGLDFRTTYTYGIVHRELARDYHAAPAMPNLLIESTYEGEHNATSRQIRRQAYWALLGGATGQFIGNRPIWLFDPGWTEALESQGARDMARLRRLVDTLPWPMLEPDDRHEAVVGGLGEQNGLDYLAAARSADRRVLVAYAPTPRTIEVAASAVRGDRIAGWWFDPLTGRTVPIAPAAAHDRFAQQSPFDEDAVLVLHDAGLSLDPPTMP
jgi:hypothetical protein